MAEPFLSEIRLMCFNYPPREWALCNGQLLPINQNQALFSLLGTTFGGNGQTTFALPDLRGRVPVHVGAGHTLGEAGGEQAHTLTQREMPQHFHDVHVSSQRLRRRRQPDQQLPGECQQPLPLADRPDHDEPRDLRQHRRKPGAPEHAALLTLSFCIASSASSRARTDRRHHGPTLCRRDQDVRWQLRARRVDVLRRPAVPISENETLFHLIGTTYGGDGQRPSPCRTCADGSRCTKATWGHLRRSGRAPGPNR